MIRAPFSPPQVSVGSAHTLALTRDGTIYAFGCGASGQLGLPGETDDHSCPQRLDALRHIAGPVVHVAAGGQFSLAVSERGEVYAFGSGQEWGVRGWSWTSEQPIQPVRRLQEQGVHAVRVAASSAVCAVMDILGRVGAADTLGAHIHLEMLDETRNAIFLLPLRTNNSRVPHSMRFPDALAFVLHFAGLFCHCILGICRCSCGALATVVASELAANEMRQSHSGFKPWMACALCRSAS